MLDVARARANLLDLNNAILCSNDSKFFDADISTYKFALTSLCCVLCGLADHSVPREQGCTCVTFVPAGKFQTSPHLCSLVMVVHGFLNRSGLGDEVFRHGLEGVLLLQGQALIQVALLFCVCERLRLAVHESLHT